MYTASISYFSYFRLKIYIFHGPIAFLKLPNLISTLAIHPFFTHTHTHPHTHIDSVGRGGERTEYWGAVETECEQLFVGSRASLLRYERLTTGKRIWRVICE
ncbi:hypothetical protein ABFS83_14G037100 [Erythranthe nasuta]